MLQKTIISDLLVSEIVNISIDSSATIMIIVSPFSTSTDSSLSFRSNLLCTRSACMVCSNHAPVANANLRKLNLEATHCCE